MLRYDPLVTSAVAGHQLHSSLSAGNVLNSAHRGGFKSRPLCCNSRIRFSAFPVCFTSEDAVLSVQFSTGSLLCPAYGRRSIRQCCDPSATPSVGNVRKKWDRQTDRQTGKRRDTRPLLYAYHCGRSQHNSCLSVKI